MSRTIELTEKELSTLLTNNELAINLASRTIHIFNSELLLPKGRGLLMLHGRMLHGSLTSSPRLINGYIP